jgi:hypothetical protein
MSDKCNGCGRVGVAVNVFRCIWPDGRTSVERHCAPCQRLWHRQLKALGARVERADTSEEVPDIHTVDE